MKIRMIKKATVFLMAAVMVLATATGAFAVAYYEAGTAANNLVSTAIEFNYDNGVKTLVFMGGDKITAPGAPDTILNKYQAITGSYSLSLDHDNIYNLTNVPLGTSTISVQNAGLNTTYFSAQATALQINFGNGTISWSSITDTTYNNTIGSSVIDSLQASSTYAFTTFTFENTIAVSDWLAGTQATNPFLDVRYYSKLEGFAAAPEPAEWMLMFIGLGMLGFYLQRRGYLNFELSPQAVA
jgi:hypothetical protein